MDIESETQAVLDHCGIRVNIDFAASNIHLSESEFLDTDGAYIKHKDKHYIWINSLRPYVRRRFSTGHEFGHYYMGHPSDVSMEVQAAPDKRKEAQANRFSAALLMPRDPFYKIHCVTSTIREIAEWFRVSDICAAIRLLELGLRTEEAEMVKADYYGLVGDPVYEEV